MLFHVYCQSLIFTYKENFKNQRSFSSKKGYKIMVNSTFGHLGICRHLLYVENPDRYKRLYFSEWGEVMPGTKYICKNMCFIPEVLKYIVISPNRGCFVFVKCLCTMRYFLIGIEHLMFFTDPDSPQNQSPTCLKREDLSFPLLG